MSREFRRKLRALLDEYDAHIEWRCDECSDLHGVTGQHVVVMNDKGKVLARGGAYSDALYRGDL